MENRFELLAHQTADGVLEVPLYIDAHNRTPAESVALLKTAEVVVATMVLSGVPELRDKVGSLLAGEIEGIDGLVIDEDERADVVRINRETTSISHGRCYDYSYNTTLLFDMLHFWSKSFTGDDLNTYVPNPDFIAQNQILKNPEDFMNHVTKTDVPNPLSTFPNQIHDKPSKFTNQSRGSITK